ncbi:RHS repeat-associated core domain-containing protein [Chitinophaga costaii]|uniref:RHS repeat-associated core domain-containing protein n=1 Tax=Chitinophaga costaii TaxID=1335309 RepID=A0A1C4E9T4_9BACT|nr:RHS repeat-associated core domain-containing protein [Chitinophaga costaii]PUZ24224.1 hypothetical protein DCM91_12365 [Chitinophaga costaii]SCC40379.1 RHS repeat-associated core domain-containing protein [Chitinophaga costaii]
MRYHLFDSVATQWSNSNTVNDYKEIVRYDANGNILNYQRNGTTQNSRALAMDQLSYFYQPGNNRLTYIRDAVNKDNYKEDLDNQPLNNYQYDQIGNLTQDLSGGVTAIQWTVYGKIRSVSRGTAYGISYGYDPGGNRISKTITSSNPSTSFYIRDAQGNVLALYEYKAGTLTWKEQHLYGSKRLGIWQPNRPVGDSLLTQSRQDTLFTGDKQYELSNHLGNVLATVSDKKIAVPLNDSTTAYYTAAMLSQTDYYPFGMIMPGRGSQYDAGTSSGETGGTGSSGTGDCADGSLPDNLQVNQRGADDPAAYKARNSVGFTERFVADGSSFVVTIDPDASECVPVVPGEGSGGVGGAPEYHDGYRYGFNGKENDNEVKGDGDQQDYGFRIYNPQIGRFLSTDPLSKKVAFYTPYQFSGNKPIVAVDVDGQEDRFYTISFFDKQGKAVFTSTRNEGTVIGVERNGYELYDRPEKFVAEYNLAFVDGTSYSLRVSFDTYKEMQGVKQSQFLPQVVSLSMLKGVDIGVETYGGAELLYSVYSLSTRVLARQMAKAAVDNTFVTVAKQTEGKLVKTGVKNFENFGGEFLDDATRTVETPFVPKVAPTESGFKTLSELGLKDGMNVSPNKALELGEQFLGKGYKELVPNSGRFVSADGTRVVRMGVSDITGAHGGWPHMNFETLIPNPAKTGKMMVDKNIHVYLKD